VAAIWEISFESIGMKRSGAKALGFVAAVIAVAAIFLGGYVWLTLSHQRAASIFIAGMDQAYPSRYMPVQHRTYPSKPDWDPDDLSPDAFPHPFSVEPKPRAEESWKIMAVGDIMASADLQLTAYLHRNEAQETSGGYDWILQDVSALVSGAELAIGNLETPISPSAPRQGRGRFNADPIYLDALRKLGFDLLFTANNHTFDQGVKGIEETRRELEQRGFLHLGTSPAGQDRREYLIVPIKGRSILNVAFLNYSTHLNSPRYVVEYYIGGANVNLAITEPMKGFRSEIFRYIAKFLFPSVAYTEESSFLDSIARNAERARAEGAEYVIVFLHWGRSGHGMPTRQQRELALAMFLRGADAVIGAGPHMVQPFEVVYTKGGRVLDGKQRGAREHLIAYSLGNFVGHHRGPLKYGMALAINLARNKDGIYLQDVRPQFLESAAATDELVVEGKVRSLDTYRLRRVELREFLDYIESEH
jgi:poly-gamma-glutamate synthesis protein (capsule biosynthesis protein)